jgi:hypothetical protein
MSNEFSYCTGNSCPLKGRCLRFLESFEAAMKWIMPSYKDNKCDNFIQ